MWYGKLVSKITKFIFERRDRPTTVPSNQIAERQVVLVYDQSDHADFSKRDLIGHISYALDNMCPDTAHGTLDRESSVKMALLENCLVETPLSNALID